MMVRDGHYRRDGASKLMDEGAPPQAGFLKAANWMRHPGVPFDVWRTARAADWILHRHDFFEVVIVLHGVIEHLIFGNSITASAGDVFSIPPGVEHGYANPVDCGYISVIFDDRFMTRQFPELADLPEYRAFMRLEPSRRRDRSFREFLKLGPHDLILLDDIVRKIEGELESKSTGYYVIALSGLVELVVRICRHYSDSARFGSGTLVTIARVISYMESSYADPIRLDDLAARACMSKRSFLRRFEESTGETPMRFLLQCRLTHARRLLKTSSLNITEVAAQVGYDDPNHFASIFKSVVGMSPREFRARGTWENP